MPALQDQIGLYREELQRVLASQEFGGLRQLRDFLSYVSEAAFQGRSSIDQLEIAERVLGRGKDFNPIDDACVRKDATVLRQRLKRYYQGEGAADPVIISLPVRSYIPHFEIREKEAEPEIEAVPVDQPARPRRRWPMAVGVTAAVLVIGAAALEIARTDSPTAPLHRPSFLLHTLPGDIMHTQNDLPGNGVQVGPALGPVDELTVRMAFTPERATQQAGILVFTDADQYVKFGRQFLARPQLEFGLEYQGRYRKPLNTFTFDPDGQTGEPVWLSIRRERSAHKAFLSNDGSHWRRVGNVLEMPGPLAAARAAIFADNGRSNAPSCDVRFDRLSVGPSFHDWPPGPTTLDQFEGWTRDASSPVAGAWSFDPDALVYSFVPSDNSYNARFVKPVPKGDWVVSARLDFLSMNGSTAGLILGGSKGEFRLIRWDLDRGCLTAEHTGHRQVNRSDFDGSPPVILRLESRNGVVRGRFSRDDVHYELFPLEVSMRELGEDLKVGLYASQSSWTRGGTTSPARFFYFRQEVSDLRNYR